jgi:hypothetical protein
VAPLQSQLAADNQNPLHAEASEAVFQWEFVSRTLGGNASGLLIYSLISSWQDIWTNTQHNKLQSVQL